MTGLTLAVALQMTFGGGDADSYAKAWEATTQTGKPMVVLVGAEWCPACVDMKQNVMPKVRQRGLLRWVAFAEVDYDRQKELGRELTRGGPIPQLLMYRKSGDSWRVRRLVGKQEFKSVQTFFEAAIIADQQAERTDSQPAPEAATVQTASFGKAADEPTTTK